MQMLPRIVLHETAWLHGCVIGGFHYTVVPRTLQSERQIRAFSCMRDRRVGRVVRANTIVKQRGRHLECDITAAVKPATYEPTLTVDVVFDSRPT